LIVLPPPVIPFPLSTFAIPVINGAGVPDFSGIAIPRQIDPGPGLRRGIVPTFSIINIVIVFVDIVGLVKLHHHRQGRRHGHGLCRGVPLRQRMRHRTNPMVRKNIFFISGSFFIYG
jgi:hypothetical protein